MPDPSTGRVAIVDYGMGNLFSVQRACEYAGLQGLVTSSGRDILEADAVVLPGVGAFGTAVEHLKKLDLIGVLRDAASSSKPFIGVCLGMQLLMDGSCEFGEHRGLGVIEGRALYLEEALDGDHRLKVPHVGWDMIHAHTRSGSSENAGGGPPSWRETPLEGLQDGVHLYFVHSLYVKPDDPSVIRSTTRFGANEFCSSFSLGNVFGCQFHPERSGVDGLKVYQNLANLIGMSRQEDLSATEATSQIWPS